jgi:hypothetical protein
MELDVDGRRPGEDWSRACEGPNPGEMWGWGQRGHRTNGEATVIETSHTLEIERSDDPSTRRLRMRTRVSNGSLFMPRII